VNWNTDAVTFLAVDAAVTVYAAVLWLVRRRALQNLALFAGLVVTIFGIAGVVAVPVGTGPASPHQELTVGARADPRRQELERIGQRLGVKDTDRPLSGQPGEYALQGLQLERIAHQSGARDRDRMLLDLLQEQMLAEGIEKYHRERMGLRT
jgi:hypothetical protein